MLHADALPDKRLNAFHSTNNAAIVSENMHHYAIIISILSIQTP